MRRRWIALLVLVAAVAAVIFAISRACSGDDNGGPTPSGVTPTPDIISSSTAEKEGLELTVQVDDKTYDVGDTVTAHAEIKNTRGDTVTYQAIAPDLPAFRLEVVAGDLEGEQLMEPDGDAPPESGELKRESEMKIDGKWDQQLDIPQDPVQAPPGKYSIRATFVGTVPGIADPVTVQTAATFRLEGGDQVLTPLDILGRAIQTDELQGWMRGRAQNVICAYPPTGRFYQGFATNKTVAETFDFLYASQREGGLPICGIGTDNGVWRLNFYSNKGGEPNRFNMLFNLSDGTLIAVEEPTPEPGPSSSPAP